MYKLLYNEYDEYGDRRILLRDIGYNIPDDIYVRIDGSITRSNLRLRGNNRSYKITTLLTIFDKLSMTTSINEILRLYIPLNRLSDTQIIHHTLQYGEIINAYKQKYNVLFNNADAYHIQKPNMNFRCAIENGMVVKNICARVAWTNDENMRLFSCAEKVNADFNVHITTCAPFAKTLRALSAQGGSGICDNGLLLCTSITTLNADENIKITTCAPFSQSLRELSANGRCGINNGGLSLCTSLEDLYVCNNRIITICDPLAQSLRKLIAFGDRCGICDASLHLCKNITKLNIMYNNKVTTCKPFIESLCSLIAESSHIINTDASLQRSAHVNIAHRYNLDEIKMPRIC